MMRRSQRHHAPQLRTPSELFALRNVTRASSNEPTHAMAKQIDFRDSVWPSANDSLEKVRELSAILGNMNAAVVVEVDRREALLGEFSAVVMTVPQPLPVIHG